LVAGGFSTTKNRDVGLPSGEINELVDIQIRAWLPVACAKLSPPVPDKDTDGGLSMFGEKDAVSNVATAEAFERIS
jgi:hypothetical protein